MNGNRAFASSREIGIPRGSQLQKKRGYISSWAFLPFRRHLATSRSHSPSATPFSRPIPGWRAARRPKRAGILRRSRNTSGARINHTDIAGSRFRVARRGRGVGEYRAIHTGGVTKLLSSLPFFPADRSGLSAIRASRAEEAPRRRDAHEFGHGESAGEVVLTFHDGARPPSSTTSPPFPPHGTRYAGRGTPSDTDGRNGGGYS